MQARLLAEATRCSRLHATMQRAQTAAEEMARKQVAMEAEQAQAFSAARTEAEVQVRVWKNRCFPMLAIGLNTYCFASQILQYTQQPHGTAARVHFYWPRQPVVEHVAVFNSMTALTLATICQARQRELADQRAASAAERAELAEQRLQQRTELDMERLKFADDRRAMWEQLSQVCVTLWLHGPHVPTSDPAYGALLLACVYAAGC